MLGLRTQEGKEFERFFNLVQKKANDQHKVFFLDFGDGNDIEKNGMILDDLCGWLIPKSKSDLFEQLFLGNRPLDKWDDYITWAEVDPETLEITFKQYG